ncbi:hypothetical protein NLU13_2155 [Sarocladium strictum]|uniref:Uncharacterized protein n=1 Tax=Sarocladium strictum TaxID=5046 RepID=A0AA39LD11_SARSR|nr:hypothetical protein NLU13_2155 [Sarocladium strictum]
MFGTKSTQSLKNLFAGYHEPAALSKQHSQKLLDGLKTSFRSQLDREHGHITNSASAASKAAAGNETIRRPSPAQQHLKTILTNPLFSYDKDTPNILSQPSLAVKRDPMDVFEQAASKGMLTIQAATGCLIARNQLVQQASPNATSDAKETASRVLRWLHSSENMKDMQFMSNYRFTRAFMPCLVEAGMDDVVWEWLSRSLESDRPHPHAISYLLLQLVWHKGHPRNGDLDSCITALLKAEQMFRAKANAPDLLVRPWQAVSWLSTVEAYRRRPASEKLFDAHVHTADRLPGKFPVEQAHLHLLHPKHPDNAPALHLFQDKPGLKSLLTSFAATKETKSTKTVPVWRSIGSWVSSLGQDTVDSLTRSGRDDEAKEITRFLELDVPELLGHTPQPT